MREGERKREEKGGMEVREGGSWGCHESHWLYGKDVDEWHKTVEEHQCHREGHKHALKIGQHSP